MTPTETKYVEKLKEAIHLLLISDWATYERLKAEISAFEKRMNEEVKEKLPPNDEYNTAANNFWFGYE